MGRRSLLLIVAVFASNCVRTQGPVVEHPKSELNTDHGLKMTFVDVKEGDAILIHLDGTNVLVDAGRRGGCENLLSALGSLPIHTLFVTHPHNDHYGCASEVLAHVTVGEIITNGEGRGPPRDPAPMPEWDDFVAAAGSHQLELGHLKVGDVVRPADGLTITVLSTGSPEGGEFPGKPDGDDINNDSLVLMLEFAGKRVLLSGDIENAAGKMLVSRYCAGKGECPALHADVLKVSHHGSAKFELALFEAVKPTWAVISADYNFTSHGLPRVETIQALLQLGAKVFSTSAEGTENVVLEISSSGEIGWTHPQSPIFAWTKEREARTFPQGRPAE